MRFMMYNYKESNGMIDILKSPTGMVTFVVFTFTTAYVCHRLLFHCQWTFNTAPTKRTGDDTKDREAQMKAREAAEKRHKLWKATQKLKKMATLKSIHNPASHPDSNKQILDAKDVVHRNIAVSPSMSMEEIIASSLPLYDDGFIMFRNMFQMPNADQTAATLRRLAHEFVPIIRQRQYNVISVSEFCCCGDGMDYQFGGRSLSVRPGERISGHESERVMGYNRVILPNGKNRNGGKQYFHIDTERYTSSIHLRLRSPYDHTQLIPYEQVCENFCHELAHCVYHDHSPEFYALMRDIQIQHRNKSR
jgi:WLM domain